MKREDFSYLNGIKGIAVLVIIIYHYIPFANTSCGRGFSGFSVGIFVMK